MLLFSSLSGVFYCLSLQSEWILGVQDAAIEHRFFAKPSAHRAGKNRKQLTASKPSRLTLSAYEFFAYHYTPDLLRFTPFVSIEEQMVPPDLRRLSTFSSSFITMSPVPVIDSSSNPSAVAAAIAAENAATAGSSSSAFSSHIAAFPIILRRVSTNVPFSTATASQASWSSPQAESSPSAPCASDSDEQTCPVSRSQANSFTRQIDAVANELLAASSAAPLAPPPSPGPTPVNPPSFAATAPFPPLPSLQVSPPSFSGFGGSSLSSSPPSPFSLSRWIHLSGHCPSIIYEMASRFGLNSFEVDDTMSSSERPKITRFSDGHIQVGAQCDSDSMWIERSGSDLAPCHCTLSFLLPFSFLRSLHLSIAHSDSFVAFFC